MAKPLPTRMFRDPLYDYMSFGQRVCSIIDTKHFQRLRRVKQLGTTYYVWPTACHNRFEHCLGVAYLAQMFTKHLQTAQPELGITDDEVDLVTIAGLCHDLGHGPWSHVWDGLFIPQAIPGTTWQHEHASEMMFDDLVKEYNINLTDDEVVFIKALIAGEPSRCKGMTVKPYLFDIVANKRNGLDVDKFDYIARDSKAVGHANITTLTRLIHSARVIDDEITYNIKDVNEVYQVFHTRFSLHKQIYNHKTAKAIEYMIIDGMLAAEPHMKIAERIKDPKQFLHLSDSIKEIIEASTSEELAASRAIFDRIASRDLYKMVDSNIISWKDKDLFRKQFTAENIVKAVKSYSFAEEDNVKQEVVAALDAKDVIVDLSHMHYGMKDENPLKYVKFYSKRRPDVCLTASPADISLIMPEKFGEVLVRAYTRKDCYFGLVQVGYRLVLEQLNKRATLDLDDSGDETEKPVIPGPARKRRLGRTVSAPLPPSGQTYLDHNRFMTVPKAYQPPHKRPRKCS